ncbi:ATP-dependent DNA helicase [Aphis craccivora]|uniref:ATP-dependent DNA helicase n=1 Tax=Aphis craccivora TaxID=307492 RepID=A0A6G0ZG52_APHCR|nr:ATP-dependent DNA helicase [Aphis craccivora]
MCERKDIKMSKLQKPSVTIELLARYILVAKKYDVNTINITIVNEMLGDTTSYQSIDTVMNQDKVVKYPTKSLKSLDLLDIPLHILTLKFSMTIIVL